MESPEKKKAFEKEFMGTLDLSDYTLLNSKIPKRIYCNKLIMEDLIKAFNDLVNSKLLKDITSYDGCFNVRYIRGYESKKLLSNHSWGIALDFNAYDNPIGFSREQCIAKGLKPFSKKFTDIFKENGFDNGFAWTRKDGMHFEYNKI